MKKLTLASLLTLSLLSFFSINGFSQTTTVTATILFPDGQPFVNGMVEADFTPISGNISVFTYKLNGAPFPYNVSGNMNGSGTFSLTLTDDHVVSPQGGRWKFTVCSNANLPCASTVQDVFGGSIDLSSQINATVITAVGNSFNYPKFYNDTEAALNIGPGIAYYNLNSNKIRFYNGTIWQDISTGGGGGGNINPGTANSQAILWNTGSSLWVPQNKAVYDTRDWATCDGTTDSTSGINNLKIAIASQEATIRVIGSTTPTAHCRLDNISFPSNITLDFSGGGAIEMISSTTPPGGATFVSGTSTECGSASTCAITFSTTAGNTIVLLDTLYPGFTFKFTSVIDTCGDVFYHVQQSPAGFPRNSGVWVASNVAGGSCTITATANGTLTNSQLIAWQFSGMGPVVSIDGQGASTDSTGTTMSAGPTTTTSGSLIIGYGGQPFTSETCTAGAGYTQPAGAAGQSSSGFICGEYHLSGAGGATSATQTITVDPSPGTWIYSILALKPGNATGTILGGIIDPDLHQIFFNADGVTGHGVIDFTGSTVLEGVHPEWWGASLTASAANNTLALQAAIYGAFGCGPLACRTNGSGLAQYNRPLILNAQYSINNELQWYHVIGSTSARVSVICHNGGITQTASNKRIMDAQSLAYVNFYNCAWLGQASNTNALLDIDFNGTQGADLAPQFIDFYSNSWNGGGVTDVGLLLAKSGGGAQGSNINIFDGLFNSFTGAGYQIGGNNTGRNVGRFYAQNAIVNDVWNGDNQGNPLYGVAVYGGGLNIHGMSFENGFATQTGFDFYCEAAQYPCVLENSRSESRRLAAGNPIHIYNSHTIDQSAYPTPGNTQPVGTIIKGTVVGGDGKYYKVTSNAGPFDGIGLPNATIGASSGTATTIVDTNETITGANTVKLFTLLETVTQSVTGASATILNTPTSTGTITGSVTSGTIGSGDTMTQSTTGVTCISSNAPTSNASLQCTNFSGTADNSHIWTDGTTGGTYTPTAVPTFSIVTMLITAHTGSPDNSHSWIGGTSGAVFIPTIAPAGINFPVNGFIGMLASILSGTNTGCYGHVTSNTATSITVTTWVTKYLRLVCGNPDNTSNFVVEPNWGTQFSSSGGSTWVDLNEYGIDGITSGVGLGFGILENVDVPGDMIHVGSFTMLKNVSSTRADWYGPSANFLNGFPINTDLSVTLDPTVSVGGSNYFQSWNFTGGNRVANPFTSYTQHNLGTTPFVWSTGGLGGGVGALDTWVGGRSDPTAQTDITRNILEFGGMLGRAAAFGLNQNGTDTQLTGGPSTGSGNGGAICHYTSVPSGSSSTVNSGAKRFCIDSNGTAESFLTTGTPPFAAASTTPVTNLTTVPTTYNIAGTQQINTHIVEDSGILVSGTPSTATITLVGSAVFISNTTYNCTLTNKTNQANNLAITYTDGSHFVVTGPNTVTDNFSFLCVGK